MATATSSAKRRAVRGVITAAGKVPGSGDPPENVMTSVSSVWAVTAAIAPVSGARRARRASRASQFAMGSVAVTPVTPLTSCARSTTVPPGLIRS